MANVVLKRSDKFPVGTAVGAYSVAAVRQREGKPSGAATETETVDSTGTLTFTALAANTAYGLYATVGGENRHLAVSNSKYVAPGTLKERIKALREAVGAI